MEASHGIDHKRRDPKKIDRQPTKFLRGLHCQKIPRTGPRSPYLSNPKIIPTIQESHQQEVGCSSGPAPATASFPKSISMDDNRQGNPFMGQNQGCSRSLTKEHRLLPGQVVLVIYGRQIMTCAMYQRLLQASRCLLLQKEVLFCLSSSPPALVNGRVSEPASLPSSRKRSPNKSM